MAGLVTVIGKPVRDECMRDGTDENDDADTTSVTAELRKIAELPNVQRSGVTYEYKTQLIDMASALEQRWAEVQAQNEKRMMDKTLLSNFDYSLSWARTVIGASAKRRPRGSKAAPDHTMRCSPAIDGGLVDTPVSHSARPIDPPPPTRSITVRTDRIEGVYYGLLSAG